MLLPELTYHRASSVRDALRLLSDHPGARPLAGGQTLLNAMKLRLVAPPVLVDISALDELRTVEVTAEGALRIGAGVTYAQLERSDRVRATYSVAAEVAAGTVDRQVRNRGTIGGNCCLADPTSNFPPLLVALDARMHVTGPAGERVVPADAFFTGPLRVDVGRDELLTAVELPPPDGARVAYRTLQKAPDSWAIARAVARLHVAGGVVDDVRIVLGCVAPGPVRATAMERALIGEPATTAAVERASELATTDLDPPSDVHASAEYRRAMAGVYAKRAALAALPGGTHDA